jgi:DnaJ-domain-containing protein 1
MPERNGESAQTLGFIYKLTAKWEDATLSNDGPQIDWRRHTRRHRIVKKTARWVHVEDDSYPPEGGVSPIEPDKKRRTFALNRRELEEIRGTMRRGDDSGTYHLTVRDALLSFAVLNSARFARWENDRFRERINAAIEENNRIIERLTHGIPSTQSCFAALGLKPGASIEEVKSAFRRLCLKHHPDAGGNHTAFVKLRKTYEQALCLVTMNNPG